MEGVGSRLGRASSRYGQTATVFSGPVRRWKKRWVHVPSSSSSPSLTYHSKSNGHNNKNNNSSTLLLCRWTPISPSTAAAAATEEPPRRKFRYTPVSVLEEKKKAAEKKAGNVEKASEASIGRVTKEQDEELDKNQSGLQDSIRSHLDLDLGLKGHSADLDSINQIKETQFIKGSSGRFWLG